MSIAGPRSQPKSIGSSGKLTAVSLNFIHLYQPNSAIIEMSEVLPLTTVSGTCPFKLLTL
jgi:hypothetical protein